MDHQRSDGADLASWAFKVHYGHVYRFLLRRTGSRDEAEDLAQEVFADAASALRDFRPGASPVLALLYTLAQRRFADAARRRLRTGRTGISLDELDEPLPERVHDELLAGALRRAFERLPPDLRAVAAMKLVQGRSFAEIASSVGASEAACRKRFQRALEAMRSFLAQEGFGR